MIFEPVPLKPSKNSERTGSTEGNVVKGVASDGLKGTVIQRGFIVGVNPDKWSMTVQTVYGRRRIVDCSIPSVYAHRNRGEGIHFIPEVGADVWLCFPSEDSRPFPLCYIPPAGQDGSSKANRPNLTPGSYAMLTRDGNGIKIHRGGLVEIESTPICKMIFLPREDAIVTLAQEWRLETPSGRMHFYTGEPGELPNDQLAGRFLAQFKQEVNQKHHSVDLSVGSDVGVDGVFQLDIFESGDVETEDQRTKTLQVVGQSDGDMRIGLASGKDLQIGSLGGTSRYPVVINDSFFTDVAAAFTEVKAVLSALGLPTTNIDSLLVNLFLPTESNPYLSQYVKAE